MANLLTCYVINHEPICRSAWKSRPDSSTFCDREPSARANSPDRRDSDRTASRAGQVESARDFRPPRGLRDCIRVPLSPSAGPGEPHGAAVRPGHVGEELLRLRCASGAADFCCTPKLEPGADSIIDSGPAIKNSGSPGARQNDFQDAD